MTYYLKTCSTVVTKIIIKIFHKSRGFKTINTPHYIFIIKINKKNLIMLYSREKIEAAVKSKGYVYFEDSTNKCYDVNIIGVRNSEPGNKVTDLFDDVITISYKDEKDVWQYHEWMNTTDPGKKGVQLFEQYGVKDGVARVVPGQYRGSHMIGLHQGKYEALRQKSPIKVYRDGNKDSVYDETKITEGVYWINIHKAGQDSTWVSNW